MFGNKQTLEVWYSDKYSIDCVAPPVLQPGVVVVALKHDYPNYSAPQQPESQGRIFTYVTSAENASKSGSSDKNSKFIPGRSIDPPHLRRC